MTGVLGFDVAVGVMVARGLVVGDGLAAPPAEGVADSTFDVALVELEAGAAVSLGCGDSKATTTNSTRIPQTLAPVIVAIRLQNADLVKIRR